MADFILNLRQPPLAPRATRPIDVDACLSEILECGVNATWYATVRCPCGRTGESSPDRVCPVCAGKGWIYPLQQSVVLLATGLRRDFRGVADVAQAFYTGEAQFTVRAECAPSYQDRIVLDDCRTTKTALLTRKSNPATVHVEDLNYPIVAQEYTTSTGTTATLDVLYLRPQKADGYPDSALVKGTDFDITAGGDLDFTKGDVNGKAPGLGRFYTISYKTRPVFRVMTFPHAVRQTKSAWLNPANPPQRLPVQFTAKLEWMVEGL